MFNENFEKTNFYKQIFSLVERFLIEVYDTKPELYSLTLEDLAKGLEFTPVVHVSAEGLFVIGDLHGNFGSLLNAYMYFYNYLYPKRYMLVFLGDYVDRGKEYQLQTLFGVLSLKRMLRDYVIVLRGNHECPKVNFRYGLGELLHSIYGKKDAFWIDVLKYLARVVYKKMPLLATANLGGGKVVLAHGGPPRDGRLNFTMEESPKDISATDILWSDPDEHIFGFLPNPRGVGILYGEDFLLSFLRSLGASLFIRGHEHVRGGYRVMFKNRLITLNSSFINNDKPMGLIVTSSLNLNFVHI